MAQEQHGLLEGILSDGQKYDLECLCDRYGIDQILDALADIASEKADHIEHMWQDADLAHRWHQIASLITKAANKSVGL